MSTAQIYPTLDVNPNGSVYVAGTRYKVLHLAAEHYQHGWTAEEILRQHPDLTPSQVYAALAYFYDHHDSLVKELNRTAEQTRAISHLSRDELRSRDNG
jgi:uncharacterized protein (DUF433 family)